MHAIPLPTGVFRGVFKHSGTSEQLEFSVSAHGVSSADSSVHDTAAIRVRVWEGVFGPRVTDAVQCFCVTLSLSLSSISLTLNILRKTKTKRSWSVVLALVIDGLDSKPWRMTLSWTRKLSHL